MKFLKIFFKTLGVFILSVIVFSTIEAFLVKIFLYGKTNLGMYIVFLQSIVFVPSIITTFLFYKKFKKIQ